MEVAIVILNWNGKDLLEQFLPSVVKFSNVAKIYLADNASEDDSIAFVNQNFPTVSIIQNQSNGGFAKGYNDALKSVDADVLCLLNNDVEVTHQWLEPIIRTFEEHSETAIIQPKILDHKQKDQFEYAGAAGGFIDKYGFPYCRGRIFSSVEKDHGQFNDQFSVFWASGACFFIRKTVFDELNGFDESFFAHMEEIDLCWRAFNCNYQSMYIGQSTVYHVGGATLSETNPTKTYLNFRNSLFMLTKNVPSNKLFLVILTRLILDGIAGIKFMVQGDLKHTWAVIRAHFSYYKQFSKLFENRSSIFNSKKYYQKRSIVWSHFVNNKKDFKSL